MCTLYLIVCGAITGAVFIVAVMRRTGMYHKKVHFHRLLTDSYTILLKSKDYMYTHFFPNAFTLNYLISKEDIY